MDRRAQVAMAGHRWQWQDTGTQTCDPGGSGRDTRTRDTGTRGTGTQDTGGDVRDGDKHTWHKWRWRGRASARGRGEGAPWRRPGRCGLLSVRVPAAPPSVRCAPVSPCPAAPALSSGGSTSHIPRAWASGGLRRGPSTHGEPLAARASPREPRHTGMLRWGGGLEPGTGSGSLQK